MARLILWNANGITDKRTELTQLLHELDVDFALLQETHLRPADKLTFTNYTVYRTDRPGNIRRGGTAILVHRRVTHRPLPCPVPGAEVTTIATQILGSEVKISSMYHRPQTVMNHALLHHLLQDGSPSIVAGDLNSKHPTWGCRARNANGNRLRHFLDANPHIGVAAPTHPTHYPHNPMCRPDILDIALHSSLTTNLTLQTISDLSSDHLPVLLLLDNVNDLRLPPSRRPKIQWSRYYRHLVDHPKPPVGPATSPAQLDQQVEDLQAALQQAIRAATMRPGDVREDYFKVLPPPLMAEVRLRRRLRRVWQHTRLRRDKARFNRQSRRVSGLLMEHSEGRWRDFLATQSTEDGSLWRLTKALRRGKPATVPLHGQRGLVYSPADKAESFADSLEDQFSPHADIYDDDHCDRVEDYLESLEDDSEDEEEEPSPIEEAEVVAALSRLRPKKAPGPDHLGAPALRRLPPWVITAVTAIFNSCLTLHHFPKPWKTAKVILIPKPGKNPLFPENHRPISLLPTLSKVLERFILSRFPEDFHLTIRSEQYGFRRGHSTTLQLTRVLSSLVETANSRHHTAAVLIDVSKAFDKVWHEGLLYKIAHSPLPRSTFCLLRSYLQDRRFTVSIGPANSTTRPVTAGVPQGSVLGPHLYALYTNDIPVAPRVTLSLYADDAMFRAPSARPWLACRYLQRQMTLLEPWLKQWRIKVNTDKSEAICFTAQNYGRVMENRIVLNRETIPWKKKVKYLGVTLDRLLYLNHHVKKRCDITRAAIAQLAPIVRRGSPLSLKTKLLIYTSIVRPALLYAAPAWYHLLSRSSAKKLDVVQSKFLRQASDSPWYVRNEVIRYSCGLPTIQDFVSAATEKMLEAARTSEWDHIRATGEAGITLLERRRRPIDIDDPP